jgi:hypothetical protein
MPSHEKCKSLQCPARVASTEAFGVEYTHHQLAAATVACRAGKKKSLQCKCGLAVSAWLLAVPDIGWTQPGSA